MLSLISSIDFLESKPSFSYDSPKTTKFMITSMISIFLVLLTLAFTINYSLAGINEYRIQSYDLFNEKDLNKAFEIDSTNSKLFNSPLLFWKIDRKFSNLSSSFLPNIKILFNFDLNLSKDLQKSNSSISSFSINACSYNTSDLQDYVYETEDGIFKHMESSIDKNSQEYTISNLNKKENVQGLYNTGYCLFPNTAKFNINNNFNLKIVLENSLLESTTLSKSFSSIINDFTINFYMRDSVVNHSDYKNPNKIVYRSFKFKLNSDFIIEKNIYFKLLNIEIDENLLFYSKTSNYFPSIDYYDSTIIPHPSNQEEDNKDLTLLNINLKINDKITRYSINRVKLNEHFSNILAFFVMWFFIFKLITYNFSKKLFTLELLNNLYDYTQFDDSEFKSKLINKAKADSYSNFNNQNYNENSESNELHKSNPSNNINLLSKKSIFSKSHVQEVDCNRSKVNYDKDKSSIRQTNFESQNANLKDNYTNSNYDNEVLCTRTEQKLNSCYKSKKSSVNNIKMLEKLSLHSPNNENKSWKIKLERKSTTNIKEAKLKNGKSKYRELPCIVGNFNTNKCTTNNIESISSYNNTNNNDLRKDEINDYSNNKSNLRIDLSLISSIKKTNIDLNTKYSEKEFKRNNTLRLKENITKNTENLNKSASSLKAKKRQTLSLHKSLCRSKSREIDSYFSEKIVKESRKEKNNDNCSDSLIAIREYNNYNNHNNLSNDNLKEVNQIKPTDKSQVQGKDCDSSILKCQKSNTPLKLVSPNQDFIQNLKDYINDKNKYRLTYSCCEIILSLLIPCKAYPTLNYKESQYNLSSSFLQKKLSFKYVQKKLREIEYFKTIVFNPEQAILFDFVHNPLVGSKDTKFNKLSNAINDRTFIMSVDEKLNILSKYHKTLLFPLSKTSYDNKLLDLLDVEL